MTLEGRYAGTLRDHLNATVENSAAKIQAFTDDVTVGRLDHGDPHAFSRRDEGRANDFRRNEIYTHKNPVE
jgi:hypothetical protein